jgi:threonine/homoserine/homoserine lactone efflux protein
LTLSFLVRGIAIGFCIAAPVGPIGLLCIRRSLVNGRVIGLATGLGAATADAFYGAIAAFGLTSVSSILVAQRFWLALGGGAFLCYLGIRIFISKAASGDAPLSKTGMFEAFLSTLVLTLTNPTTILSFVAVFTGLGLVAASNYQAAAAMVFGVFAGSALWWLFLSSAVGFFSSRIDSTWMSAVNRLSGALIFGFGIYSLATLRV